MPLRPGQVRPMLAYAVPRPFDSPRHLFEPKWDGYRCLVFLEGGEIRLQSRNLRDITADFPSLQGLHRLMDAGQAVVDGEITAWEGGRPSFSALQARTGRVVFVAFDLLELEGSPLMEHPLEERRAALERVLAGALPGQGERDLVLSPAVPERGCHLFHQAASLGLEGVVGKERGSPYLPGQRSRHWLKVKVRRTADCVIVGYRLAPGGELGSLVLAVPGQEGGGWQIVGHVGTGWDRATGARVLSLLRLLPPGPAPARLPPEFRRGVTWVEPRVVCSVAYLEVTRDGMLRHTSFLGLRPDLEPEAAGLERFLPQAPPGPQGAGHSQVGRGAGEGGSPDENGPPGEEGLRGGDGAGREPVRGGG
ncbi:MAG: non-homologous end-joining DNA ligase [Bacillota bacterium]